MKRIKNFIRFLSISIIVFFILGYVYQFLFKLLWNFDLFNRVSYDIMYDFWEKGGVFRTFRDCSLAVALCLTPIIGLILSYKLYKYGLIKFLTTPIIKLYRLITRPKVMEIEHVSIKNLGGKDKTLDEIISEKIEKEKKIDSDENTVQNLRKQIAAKIEENEKQ